ncbi:hypothetical protein MRX96_046801 [Rhipicephalus microplus]
MPNQNPDHGGHGKACECRVGSLTPSALDLRRALDVAINEGTLRCTVWMCTAVVAAAPLLAVLVSLPSCSFRFAVERRATRRHGEAFACLSWRVRGTIFFRDVFSELAPLSSLATAVVILALLARRPPRCDDRCAL